jgi:hypothetical protein
MIRKLRTERDSQQWMLDLALNMRGRVQNIEANSELKSQKEMWGFEDQFHQLRRPPNIGGLTSGEYVLDWLQPAMSGKLKKYHQRIAYIENKGDGLWGDCEWVPPTKPGQVYF